MRLSQIFATAIAVGLTLVCTAADRPPHGVIFFCCGQDEPGATGGSEAAATAGPPTPCVTTARTEAWRQAWVRGIW